MNTHFVAPTAYHPVGQTSDDRRPWRPGFIRRFPITGFVALAGAIVGIAASAAILVISNGDPITNWVFQPTVYLSIASTITNILLHYSLYEGITIAWWRRALKKETTVGDLHRYWNYGNNFMAAMLSGWHVNLVAIACILATICPINGPLLQRASTVVVNAPSTAITVNAKVATSFNDSYSGYISGRMYAISVLSQNFGAVVQQWNTNQSIPFADTGCHGNCRTTLQGVGLKATCAVSEIPYNLYPVNVTNIGSDPAVIGINGFYTRFLWDLNYQYNFTLNVAYKDTSACEGKLQIRNCTIVPATVDYPVLIDGNASTVALDPTKSIKDDVIRELWNASKLTTAIQGYTKMGGFYLALNNKFQSSVSMRFAGAVGHEVITTGNTAVQYMRPNNTNPFPGQSCDLAFANPIDDILASMRELFFRASVAAANETTPVQSVQAEQFSRRAVYKSNYAYLGAAAGVTLLTCAAVVLLYNGFWHMGRTATLNPIETAKAFGAPLLRSADGNAKVDSLLREVGTRSVRYGAVALGPDGGLRPDSMVGYDDKTGVVTGVAAEGRNVVLQMGGQHYVEEPRAGWRYSG